MVKDSLQLIKKNKIDDCQEKPVFSKLVVLKSILKVLEVDRILMYTYNAVLVEASKLVVKREGNKIVSADDADIIFIKESLRFSTLCFFKRAFLVMKILQLLGTAKPGTNKMQMAVQDNQE